MQDKRSQAHPMEPALKRALSHPKRLAIFEYLTHKGTATDEAELVEALGLTVPRAKYHLAVLHDADLIVQVEGEGHGNGRSYVAATSAAP